MKHAKVIVPYQHRSDDLSLIEIGLSEGGTPDDWRPALRDIYQGERVVWARFPGRDGRRVTVWLRDQHSARRVDTITI